MEKWSKNYWGYNVEAIVCFVWTLLSHAVDEEPFVSGATLEIITDKSQEGAQFVKGFGGIGGEQALLCI